MSLNLEFLRPGGTILRPESVDAWVRGRPWFRPMEPVDGGHQWWYQNDETGVYFQLILLDSVSSSPEAWGPSGLEARLNVLRPTYFVYEAAPFVASLAERLEAHLRDAERGELVHPSRREADIVTLWNRLHLELFEDLRNSGRNLPVTHPSANRRLWRWNRVRRRIEEKVQRLHPEAVTPALRLVRLREGAMIRLATDWREDRTTVLPPCDIVILERRRAGLAGLAGRKEARWIGHDPLVRALGDALETVEEGGLMARILPPAGGTAMRAILQKLRLQEVVEEMREEDPIRVLDDPEPEVTDGA